MASFTKPGLSHHTTLGGTGISIDRTDQGSLLIGDGEGFKLNTLVGGTGINIVNGDGTITISGTPTYTLPIASASVLGGIKVGANLSIDIDGVLSGATPYTLPIASASVLGGIKVGSGLSINAITGVLTNTAVLPSDIAYTDVANTFSKNQFIDTHLIVGSDLSLAILDHTNAASLYVTALGTGNLLEFHSPAANYIIDTNANVFMGGKFKQYNNTGALDGQLLIGNTSGGTFDAAVLTAGANVTITNGPGTITIGSTGGGGGGGTTYQDWKKIDEIVVGVGGLSNIRFSSINSTFKHLKIVYSGRSSGSSNAVEMRFNGDAGANYKYYSSYTSVSAPANGVINGGFNGSTFLFIGWVTDSSVANGAGGGEILIPNYRGTTLNKHASSRTGFQASGDYAATAINDGFWNSTAAITQIDLFIGSGTLVEGSIFSLYGLTDTVGTGGGSGTALPYVKAWSSASQTLTGNTTAKIALNSTFMDVGTAVAQHDNVTNNTRLTCRVAGTYLVGGTAVGFANAGYNPAAEYQLTLMKNGVAFTGLPFEIHPGSTYDAGSSVIVSWIIDLAVNDYIEMAAVVTGASPGDTFLIFPSGAPDNTSTLWMQAIGEVSGGGGVTESVKHNGTLVGTRPILNLIDGSNVTLTVADNSVTNAVDVTVASTGGGGSEAVQHNGSLVGTRPTINLIDGSNVTLTVADNSGSNRVDVTVASTGGGGGGGSSTGGSPNFCLGQPMIYSNAGNITASFVDGDTLTYRVSFTGTHNATDWFGVDLTTNPQTISWVTFVHGHVFADGGWFDASSEKPRIEVQLSAGSAWTLLAHITSYPATTSGSATGITYDGQSFFTAVTPTLVYGVRVFGTNGGSNQFSSCAEIQAFGGNSSTITYATYDTAVLADSPIAYYKLNELSGATTIADSSGHGYTSDSIAGGITFGSTSIIGTTSAKFNGSSGTITVAALTGHVPLGHTAYTIEVWAQFASSGIRGLVAWGNQSVTNNACGMLELSDTSMTNSTNNVDFSLSYTLGVGHWHHLVVTYDGNSTGDGNAVWYVDGVQRNTTNNWNPAISAGTFEMGTWAGGNFYDGYLSHVAIYDHALTADRVMSHFVSSAVTSSTSGSDIDSKPMIEHSNPTSSIYDDEFNDAVGMSGPLNGLNSKWIKRNLGTSTWLKLDDSIAPGCLAFRVPSGQTMDQSIYQNVPAGDFTLQAIFDPADINNRQMWFLFIVDTGGNGVGVGWDNANPAIAFRVITAWQQTGTVQSLNLTSDFRPTQLWLKKVGNVYTAAVSESRRLRTMPTQNAFTSGAQAFTAAFMGFGRIYDTGGNSTVLLEAFRLT